MAYTDTQAMKIFVVTQSWHDIAQPVVAAMTAALFEARSAWVDIQLIVSNQHFFRRNFVELRNGRNGFAAAVHKSGGNKQAEVMAGTGRTASQAKKFGIRLQSATALLRQCGNEVGPRVVARPLVFATGVAQSNNKFDGCAQRSGRSQRGD